MSLGGCRSICCQAKVGIFNLFHVCAFPFPALTFQNMVYFCFSEQLRALGAKALLSQGWLTESWGWTGSLTLLLLGEGVAFGSAVLVLLREGEKRQRSSLRNVSGLSDGSPSSSSSSVVRQ